MFDNFHRNLKLVGAVTFLAISLALSATSSAAQEERKVIYHPAPAYPESAKKLSITGTVKLHVIIAPDGRVKETKVIGGHPLLVSAAEETVKTWKYAPAPTDSTATLEFRFTP